MSVIDRSKLTPEQRESTIWDAIFGSLIDTEKGPKHIPGLKEVVETDSAESKKFRQRTYRYAVPASTLR